MACETATAHTAHAPTGTAAATAAPVRASQSRKLQSEPPTKTCRASRERHTANTCGPGGAAHGSSPGCCGAVAAAAAAAPGVSGRPGALSPNSGMSHRRTVLSKQAVATRALPGKNATPVTYAAWPVSCRRHA
jgi:hypothetical protein